MVVICLIKQATNGSFLNITIYYQVIKSIVRRPLQYEGVIIHFILLVDKDLDNIDEEPAI